MRRWASLALAVAGMTVAAGWAVEAGAQVVDMTGGRVSRCELHRAIGRQLPPECGGTGGVGGDQTRGRVVIGAPKGTTAPPPAAAGGAPPTPTQAADRAPPTREKPYGVALPVPFDFDSDRLTPAARRVVDQLADVLKLDGQDKFIIQGHTDAVGSDEYNKALSLRRAEAVIDYLVNRHGISRDRLEAQGLGESSPLLPADPNNGRNRRVQVLNVGG